jgi:hypothetical protein
MGKPVVHFEIGTRDDAKSAEFYSKLFGWKIVKDEKLNYNVIDTQSGRGIAGGIFSAPPEMPTFVTFYIASEDLQADLNKAESMGATTTMKPMPIPGVGAAAMFGDVDGNQIGLFKGNEGAQ